MCPITVAIGSSEPYINLSLPVNSRFYTLYVIYHPWLKEQFHTTTGAKNILVGRYRRVRSRPGWSSVLILLASNSHLTLLPCLTYKLLDGSLITESVQRINRPTDNFYLQKSLRHKNQWETKHLNNICNKKIDLFFSLVNAESVATLFGN